MKKRTKLKDISHGLKEGYCRICEEKGKLSVDHIPPKGCGNNRPVIILCGNEKIISQNGAKFRTICEKCNNNIGRNYDAELVRIYKEVTSNYSDLIINPNETIKFPVNPRKLLKSVCGHMLAIMFGDSVIEELQKPPVWTEYLLELRDFIINDKNMKNIIVYYWFYPFKEIKIIQYFGVFPDVINQSGSFISGSLFKFMPFGLWITNSKNSYCTPRLNILPQTEKEFTMIFNTRLLFSKDKPEMPSGRGLTLLNSESIYSITNK